MAPDGRVYLQKRIQLSQEHPIVISYRGFKDWEADRRSAGWSALQHLTFLRRRFYVDREHAGPHLVNLTSALEFTLDGCTYAGDIYNYAAEVGRTFAGHVVDLQPGWHTVTIKGLFVNRLKVVS